MNVLRPVQPRCKQLQRLSLGLALIGLLTLFAPLAHALEVTLSARYRGESSGQFEHTTPPGFACATFPSMCSRNTTVDLPITYSKRTKVSTVARENHFIRFPGPRQVDLYHDQTGETVRATLAFTVITQLVTSPTAKRNPSTGYAHGSCTMQSGRWLTATQYLYWWNINTAPAECWSYPRSGVWGQTEDITTEGLTMVYKLELQPAFQHRAGTYRTSIDYSVGSGGEFDFGDAVTELSTDALRVNIVVEVQHEFRLEFGPGFDHAVLEPPGGWAAWLEGGRVPPRLSADLSMKLWSSGPFKVYKLCEYEVGSACGIRNRRGEEVPVHVAVTLPFGIRYEGWRWVNKHPLPTGQAAALELDSMLVTANGPGQVHFEVGQDDLRPMLANGGELYSGKVTLMFDADI